MLRGIEGLVAKQAEIEKRLARERARATVKALSDGFYGRVRKAIAESRPGDAIQMADDLAHAVKAYAETIHGPAAPAGDDSETGELVCEVCEKPIENVVYPRTVGEGDNVPPGRYDFCSAACRMTFEETYGLS